MDSNTSATITFAGFLAGAAAALALSCILTSQVRTLLMVAVAPANLLRMPNNAKYWIAMQLG